MVSPIWPNVSALQYEQDRAPRRDWDCAKLGHVRDYQRGIALQPCVECGRGLARVKAWRVPNEDGVVRADLSSSVIYRGRAHFTAPGLSYVRPGKLWP